MGNILSWHVSASLLEDKHEDLYQKEEKWMYSGAGSKEQSKLELSTFHWRTVVH